MENKLFKKNIRIIEGQRNLFLFMSIVILASNILLAIKNLVRDERIILVPGLAQNVWIKNNSVSGSYIEETTILLLSHLLDISTHNIAYKKSLLLNYTSLASKDAFERINQYFLDAEDKYKKFDLTTYFTVKNVIIDLNNLTAEASGVLTSYYGKRASEVRDEKYLLSFELLRGSLKLKSFENIKDVKN